MSHVWNGSSVSRLLPSEEAVGLLAMVEEFAARELAPRVAAEEEAGTFPRDALAAMGELGLLGLPFDEAYGGGGLPYEVTLQALEEIARAWLSLGVSVSVHYLSCFPLANFGTDEQRGRWLPAMIAGDLLGGYCLSEPHSGSDAAALSTRAVRTGDEYVVSGTKAWITHGGRADFYSVMVRTSDDGPRGISCLLIDGRSPGLSSAPPERKMGATSSPTAQVILEDVHVPADRLMGNEGQGFGVALAALDAGRLGIAACAVGLAQAALDAASAYANERRQFGRSIADFQGISFLLADMATAVAGARALYLEAARHKDAGLPFGTMAAMAKLAATDAAMRVTTDAVQVLGGAGYTRDFPVERYFREAKVLQIVEGTNQVQRVVIGRAVTTPRSASRRAGS
jgi:alkylation response protein AidB-like acyl-CoA dehydrogenase